jgi:hypothetical protein
MFDDLADLEAVALLSPPPARGKAPKAVAFGASRDLTVQDVAALHAPTAQVTPRAPLQVLRYRHHRIARLIAEGHKHVRISEMVGVSPGRISVYLEDPAFRELIEHYAEEIRGEYLDVHERLAALGVSAMEELQDRLDNNPLHLTNKELKDIMESAMDRSIAPNKAEGARAASGGTQVQINFIKSEQEGAGPIIDVTPKSEEV